MRRFAVGPDDTPFTLATRCIREGVPLVVELVDALAADPMGLETTPQELGKRRYYGGGVPREGVIDWRQPAVDVCRFVRAFDYFRFESPWGRPKLRADGRLIEVKQASRTGETCTEPPGTLRGTDDDGGRLGVQPGTAKPLFDIGDRREVDTAAGRCNDRWPDWRLCLRAQSPSPRNRRNRA